MVNKFSPDKGLQMLSFAFLTILQAAQPKSSATATIEAELAQISTEVQQTLQIVTSISYEVTELVTNVVGAQTSGQAFSAIASIGGDVAESGATNPPSPPGTIVPCPNPSEIA